MERFIQWNIPKTGILNLYFMLDILINNIVYLIDISNEKGINSKISKNKLWFYSNRIIYVLFPRKFQNFSIFHIFCNNIILRVYGSS